MKSIAIDRADGTTDGICQLGNRANGEHRRSARIRIVVCVLAILTMTTSGCGDPKKNSTDNMKELSLAIVNYRGTNKAWPDNLDQVKPFVLNGKDFAKLMANPLTGDNPGYEYVKPKDSDPAISTMILYQLKDGKRDSTLPTGFADGSTRDPSKPMLGP